MNFTFKQIGIIHSCYKEKFGIPRQAGLVTEANASIELFPPYNHNDMVKDLDGFSHIWLFFIFDQNLGKGFNNLVSPPRVNGKESYGLFATRSPYRPNPLGMSVVKLEKIELAHGKLLLHIKGADLLDQTPIIDIKPYIEYSDSIINTRKGFTSKIINNNFTIKFSDIAESQIKRAEKQRPNIRKFIEQLLSQDPRPHYNKKIKSDYSIKVYEYDLHWHITENAIDVTSLESI